MKTLATEAAVKGWRRGMKCENLENLSTTTKIALNEPDCGNPSMKSIEITSHEADGTGSGCKRLG